MKTFQARFENSKFSREDPILVFDILTAFAKEASTIGVLEAHAFLLVPKLLRIKDERHRCLICNGARSDGVTFWPEVLSHFLRTYVTSATNCNAVNDLRNIHQQPQKDELTYSRRFNDAVHRCGNVHDEIDKMKLFLKGYYRVFKHLSPAFGNRESSVDFPTKNSYSMPKKKKNPIEQELPAYEWKTSLIQTQRTESYISSKHVRLMEEPSMATSRCTSLTVVQLPPTDYRQQLTPRVPTLFCSLETTKVANKRKW